MSSMETGAAGEVGRLRGNAAESLVRLLNAQTGSQFTFLGTAQLGETNGATYVQWPDGRHGVLTRTRSSIEHLERTAEILESARAAGIPAPRYELIARVQDWTVVVQERLPGTPMTGRNVDLPMMEALLSLNESFAELLVHRSDVPTVETAELVPRYAALEEHDRRTRMLLTRIRDIHDTSAGTMTGHDLVHGDFNPPNILFDRAGNLTGVVDWHDHTLYRGDRLYSLVPLRFELAWGIVRGWTPVDPAAMRRLDSALDAIEPATFQLYWTYASLNLLSAMIRENRPADIDYLLTIAWSRLDPEGH